jgi:selenocysteine lyase/cysteine desulfurase
MPAAPLTAAEVDDLRSTIPFDADRIHLNHAGDSPSSTAVVQAQIDHLRLESLIGGYEAADRRSDADDAVYSSIARLLGCGSHEIARQEHATAAWNAAFWSIPMRPGQRILTAEAAYGANAVGYLHAERHSGVSIEVIRSDRHGQVDVDELAARVDDDVALIAITHVPTNGGLVNPAAEVGAIARAAGVPYLLDACQSVGHLDLDVGEIGCDLLSATGRKYLRGPRGTGFLYVSDRLVDRLEPAMPDHHGATWVDSRRYELAPHARRFEHWEYHHAAWLGLGVAVDETLAIGADRIEATIRQQSDRLRARLAENDLPVFDLGTDRCGIVTTTVPGVEPLVARDRLRDAGINVSVTQRASTRWDFERRDLDALLRVSVHATTTDDEVERAIDELSSMRSA